MAKLIKSRLDKGIAIEYQNGRYLDSLAGLFAIQSECAAVAFYEGVFLVSYNNSATTLTQDKIKEIVEFLNNGDSQKIPLLSRYLMFNSDFRDQLENENKKSVGDKNIEFFCSFIKTNRPLLETNCYSNQGVKDAFTTKKFPVPEVGAINIEKGLAVQRIDGLLRVINEKEEVFKQVVSQYMKILTILKESIQPQVKQLKELLIRPLQDVEKIYYYFGLQIEKKKIEVEFLPNNESVHAEVNIAQKFPCGGKDFYIGVSKLCCVPCDDTLDAYHYGHRGTHGILFEKWNSPAKQFDTLVSKIKATQQADAKALSMLHRSLSYDNFESSLPDFFKMKEELGLVGDSE